jgi:hypothetical protein
MGVELLALRVSVPSDTPFGHQLRKRFPDVDQTLATEAMRVARMYGGRPEIYRALSWNTLLELSSPQMSTKVRQALEARIVAGETVAAAKVHQAHGRLKGSSLKRRL